MIPGRCSFCLASLKFNNGGLKVEDCDADVSWFGGNEEKMSKSKSYKIGGKRARLFSSLGTAFFISAPEQVSARPVSNTSPD